MSVFKLHLPFQPSGDQPAAIEKLQQGLGKPSTLLGVTGSGKTFTIANVIAAQDKPVIVLSPNKTLAGQLYEEFSLFFPENKVCYFVSYYDYYQPESYLPAQDIYIAKETKINDEIERLRVEAAASIMQRKDVIIIASISCIYSLGNPQDFKEMAISLSVGVKIGRKELINKLLSILYTRNEVDKRSGTFQVYGNSIEIHVPYQKKKKLRIELFGDEIESISWIDKINNNVLNLVDQEVIFPAKNFVTTEAKKRTAITSIKQELQEYVATLENQQYADRIQQRVAYDIEMLEQTGTCPGIENYSTHFDGRVSGQAPYCLFDFFNEDGFLLVIDESHIAIPQMGAMYKGDKARKKSLIDFGFRLPSAYDNRPLKFEESERFLKNVIYVSATPGKYEAEHSAQIVEQIIRPTGLLDPIIDLHSRTNQIQNLVEQINATSAKGFRTLVTVLTKKMAEELAFFLEEKQIKVCYLHCDLKTPQRTDLLQKLRLGIFDCLVGVNLLREGLDLPEVAFVAVMDADIEGFLRDRRSLIQIIGRAARNTESIVRLYADKVTPSMDFAIKETARRREIQDTYNQEHGIIPTTVIRDVTTSISSLSADIAKSSKYLQKQAKKEIKLTAQEMQYQIVELEIAMQQAAQKLDFETAIALRQQWQLLKSKL
ncbi:excinuclease ABC subunit UvrB [Candidatus Chromulinivorax destructor]|uniref:UvrABC system protein B n=1 Tax=Candidatus Chromulinivorax destructor TaxID=2066483 RepID=A0A345ZBE0_9BACT|nr:excinuclease ABC subunit UvrB [Candidatus Chromulinivorax destructor]AXK60607.1 excinuclease ABC subunit B [Candidatus Chromulinivorax destructor]